jgi:gas vesicle protein
MNIETKRTRGLLFGAIIGALLGAGAAYLLITAPADEESPEPVTAKELLSLTGLVAALIRKLDDIRRRT